jgi:hypothetical protein
MSDDADTDEERQQQNLRRVGYGIALSGVLTLVVAAVSTRPHGILVWGLGGLAVTMLVLEAIEGGARGYSLGFLTGSFGVWLWPQLDGGSYYGLGLMLLVVGALNAALTSQFRRLGKRLAGR